MVAFAESQVRLARDISMPQMPLNGKGQPESKETLMKVARQFESLFMNMMLKSMRSANRVLSEGNYLNSFEGQMYEDMMDEKLSIQLSSSHGLGIAELLVDQLGPSTSHRPSPFPSVSPGLANPGVGNSQYEVSAPSRQAAFSSPEAFAEDLLPRAGQAAKELGVAPEWIVAQAALETGWGSQLMHDGSGNNTHNLFGIKAGSDWQGKSVAIPSVEVVDGVTKKVVSQFRAYDSYDEALADYSAFLSERTRYSGELANVKDVEQFGQALQTGGYATDPRYGEKIARIANTSLLAENALLKTEAGK